MKKKYIFIIIPSIFILFFGGFLYLWAMPGFKKNVESLIPSDYSFLFYTSNINRDLRHLHLKKSELFPEMKKVKNFINGRTFFVVYSGAYLLISRPGILGRLTWRFLPGEKREFRDVKFKFYKGKYYFFRKGWLFATEDISIIKKVIRRIKGTEEEPSFKQYRFVVSFKPKDNLFGAEEIRVTDRPEILFTKIYGVVWETLLPSMKEGIPFSYLMGLDFPFVMGGRYLTGKEVLRILKDEYRVWKEEEEIPSILSSLNGEFAIIFDGFDFIKGVPTPVFGLVLRSSREWNMEELNKDLNRIFKFKKDSREDFKYKGFHIVKNDVIRGHIFHGIRGKTIFITNNRELLEVLIQGYRGVQRGPAPSLIYNMRNLFLSLSDLFLEINNKKHYISDRDFETLMKRIEGNLSGTNQALYLEINPEGNEYIFIKK